MEISKFIATGAVAVALGGIATGFGAQAAHAAGYQDPMSLGNPLSASSSQASCDVAQSVSARESMDIVAEVLDGTPRLSPIAGPPAKQAGPPARQTAPWQLRCKKAVTGWALYQAHGVLVCGPVAVVNPVAGLVCNLVKGAGGGAIDFNKLCDD
ncbi:hypothetical protein ACL02S_19450 [Nocardia sp. 004]|uniref:hypothetical protein n=1 Tax=Nocardia sp. 004 TaxID=3385978 RepID=UPI0039A2D1DE